MLIRQNGRKGIGLLTVLVGFLTLLIFLNLESSAHAAGSVQLTYHRTAAAPLSAQALDINCWLTIDNPHNSSHVNGNVNVVSHISCDGAMTSLTLDTKLLRGGVQVASGHAQIAGSPFLNGNAAKACVNASYQGTAHGSLVPPLGYVGPASGDVNTPVISITC